jgi:flagellar protein FlbD
MIQLTRLNGETFTLNAIYIEQIQSVPDTTITLTNGKKLMVQEKETSVRKLVTNYYQSISILGVIDHREEDT